MLNIRDFGSIEFKFKTKSYVKKIKVYQELIHDVIRLS